MISSWVQESVSLAGLLKLAGVADSGGRAKHFVQGGLVRLNGHTETHRATKIRPGDVVEVLLETSVVITVA